MKRQVVSSIVVLLLVPSLTIAARPTYPRNLRLGASVNYFAPSESAYRDLYGRGGISPAGSLSLELLGRLEVRLEVGYFQDKGKMSLTQENIKLSLLTTVLGFRYRFLESKLLSPYIGLGFALTSYQEDVPRRLTSVSETANGIAGEAGSYVFATDRLFMDINIRYVGTQESAPLGEAAQLGGLRFGIGVGYRF